jgi:hypothetical protein
LKLEPSNFQKNLFTTGFSSPLSNKNYKFFFFVVFFAHQRQNKNLFCL